MIQGSTTFGACSGHSLLAGTSEHAVIMAGEIEVGPGGVLHRWLNRSGTFRPPILVAGQSGLPFDTMWLHILGEELLCYLGAADSATDGTTSSAIQMRTALEQRGLLYSVDGSDEWAIHSDAAVELGLVDYSSFMRAKEHSGSLAV